MRRHTNRRWHTQRCKQLDFWDENTDFSTNTSVCINNVHLIEFANIEYLPREAELNKFKVNAIIMKVIGLNASLNLKHHHSVFLDMFNSIITRTYRSCKVLTPVHVFLQWEQITSPHNHKVCHKYNELTWEEMINKKNLNSFMSATQYWIVNLAGKHWNYCGFRSAIQHWIINFARKHCNHCGFRSAIQHWIVNFAGKHCNQCGFRSPT